MFSGLCDMVKGPLQKICLFQWRQFLLLDLQGDMTPGRLKTATWMIIAQETGHRESDLTAFEFIEKIAVDMGPTRLPPLPDRNPGF